MKTTPTPSSSENRTPVVTTANVTTDQTPASSTEKPSAELAGNVNNSEEILTVNTMVEGIEYPELKEPGRVIKGLDGLLVQNEARGTIFELALGIKAKETKTALEQKLKKKKGLKKTFDSYIGNLKLSVARSPRTIERYMEVVDKMTGDGSLPGVVRDALRAAKFTDDLKKEVLQLTDGMGINDLYVKYGMVEDKKSKVKGAKKDGVKKEKKSEEETKAGENLTLEQRLVLTLKAALENLEKLMELRNEMIAAGKQIDHEFKDVLDFAAETVSAITKHPLIAAMFVPVDADETRGAAA